MRSSCGTLFVALATICAAPCALNAAQHADGGATAAFAREPQPDGTDQGEPRQPGRPLQRSPKSARERKEDGNPPLLNGMPQVRTVVASLAVVLALFFGVAWVMKKNLPKSAGLLPADVVQVLGRTPLAGRQFVHLVRCGSKLLLVNVTPGGAETLTEITDPAEIDRIVGRCAQGGRHSSTASFQEVFQQMGRERSNG